MNNTITYSAVLMDCLKIKTVVLTNHDDLLYMHKCFKEDPDSAWCDGLGKKYMYLMLKQNLLAEDAYFESHIDEAVTSNERWMNFMDDCAIYAVLNEVLTGEPIKLVHPSCFDDIGHPDMKKLNQHPTLIQGINVVAE